MANRTQRNTVRLLAASRKQNAELSLDLANTQETLVRSREVIEELRRDLWNAIELRIQTQLKLQAVSAPVTIVSWLCAKCGVDKP